MEDNLMFFNNRGVTVSSLCVVSFINPYSYTLIPGVVFIVVSEGCVTSQVEIEENIFSPFFFLLRQREVEENEEGPWNKETSCIFRQTCLSWKKQFSVSLRNFEH